MRSLVILTRLGNTSGSLQNKFSFSRKSGDKVKQISKGNLYSYCGNNPTNFVDPSGLITDNEMIAQNPPMDVMARQAENAKYQDPDPANVHGTKAPLSSDVITVGKGIASVSVDDLIARGKAAKELTKIITAVLSNAPKILKGELGACVGAANATLEVFKDLNLEYWDARQVVAAPISGDGGSFHTSVGITEKGKMWSEGSGFLVDLYLNPVGVLTYTYKGIVPSLSLSPFPLANIFRYFKTNRSTYGGTKAIMGEARTPKDGTSENP